MTTELKNEVIDLAKGSPLFLKDKERQKIWVEKIIPQLEEKELEKVKKILEQALKAEQESNDAKLRVLKERAGDLYKTLMQAKIIIIEEQETKSKKEDEVILENLEKNLQTIK